MAIPLSVGIQSEAGVTGATGANTFRDIFMNGESSGLDKGFAFIKGAGGVDTGNDTSVFDHCSVDNFATAGWSFEHGQSKSHTFLACRFSASSGTGLYGVSTALGAGGTLEGGSFQWFGGGGNWCKEADFYIGNPNDTCVISGANFESSNRFLEQPAGIFTSAFFPVFIQGCRWSGDQLNADGIAINYRSGGPVVLIGNVIGQNPTLNMKFHLIGSPTYGISMGNLYGSTNLQVLNGQSNLPYHWTSLMDIQNNNNVTIGLITNEQIVNQQLYSTNSSTSASTLLTGANISGGSVEKTLNLTGAISAASNSQLPTVANLIASLGPVTQTNQTYRLRIINGGGSGSGVWTVTTNTGWTLSGTMTIAVGASRDFYVTLTDARSAITATLQAI